HGETLRRHLCRIRQAVTQAPAAARRWRALRVLLLGLAVLMVLVLAAGGWLLAGSRARLEGSRAAAGLTAPVSISRDALGTATIEGRDRTDISYALGYVH